MALRFLPDPGVIGAIGEDRAPPIHPVIAFHGLLPGDDTVIAVLDLERLLRPYAAPPLPRSGA